MKLHDKTNIYFFSVSSIIFLIGGILFYVLYVEITDWDIQEKLAFRKEYTLKQLEHSDSLILYQKYSANMVSIKPIHSFTDSTGIFSDTVIYDKIQKQEMTFRKLTFNTRIKGKSYQIEIRRAEIEKTKIIEGVLFLIIFLFASFVTVLSIVNNKLSHILWRPFYAILDQINHYQINKAEKLTLPLSSIDEFDNLSVEIQKMTTRIRDEFLIQKEFIENASHEIQTPLAIITNKLELLMQSSNLAKGDLELINSSLAAVKRLSKLNEALLIISKIENRQFHYYEVIGIKTLVSRHLSHLDDLFVINHITVKTDLFDDVEVKMNPYLAEILVENVLTNAVRHNDHRGFIEIILKENVLQISNTGAAPTKDVEKLFQRFVKSSEKSNSVGLGLSIVKGICETYSFQLDYHYQEPYHTISIGFV